MRLRWPGFMAGMDPSSRSFTLALGLSILLHAAALSVHFRLPDIIRDKYVSAPLDVVLVNSKTRARPVKADVLAQANLCLLYTSDAADDLLCVDLGGRR